MSVPFSGPPIPGAFSGPNNLRQISLPARSDVAPGSASPLTIVFWLLTGPVTRARLNSVAVRAEASEGGSDDVPFHVVQIQHPYVAELTDLTPVSATPRREESGCPIRTPKVASGTSIEPPHDKEFCGFQVWLGDMEPVAR
jgi:hypothetical protein